ncbi:MAG: hypothetical protein H6970_05270 [Gammaproteobacteria bacterium]|nr:hypothetical protein [Gammaproteobacteria bacterium]MCP5424462.1 hypothetical protein [Gammaproteobacteria bacterium]MCP5458456.1 hypothetical protein [Gammaproteobacteria bacterium]
MRNTTLVLLLALITAAIAYFLGPYRLEWEKVVELYDWARPWNAVRTDLQEARASFQSFQESVTASQADLEKSQAALRNQLSQVQEQLHRLEAEQEQQTSDLGIIQQQNALKFGEIQQALSTRLADLQRQIDEFPANYVSKAQWDTDLRMALAAAAQYQPVDIKLGPLPVGKSEDLTYTIPDTIPDTAREILIYVYVATHYVKGGEHNFKLFVNAKNQREDAFYLRAVAFAQQAWAYNSENAWLPMPADRTLRVQSDGEPLFGSWNSSIQIIAYR